MGDTENNKMSPLVRDFIVAAMLTGYVDDKKTADFLFDGIGYIDMPGGFKLLESKLSKLTAEEKTYHMNNLWITYAKVRKRGLFAQDLRAEDRLTTLFAKYVLAEATPRWRVEINKEL